MNMYVAKKYALMFMTATIPLIFFVLILLTSFDLVFGTLVFFIAAVVMIVVTNHMLRHPLTGLIEGKGMLTLTLDSTGFIESFLVQADQPFVRGKVGKNKQAETMFDRDITQYLVPPQEGRLVDATMLNKQGQAVGKRKVLLMPTPEEKADYLFAFGTYPTFIYNKVLDTFLQKKLLSNFEQTTFTKHAVMYLLKKTEELSSSVRDFSRYIVEQTRPKSGWFAKNKVIVYAIIAAAVIIMILLFAPAIMNSMQGVTIPDIPGGGGGVINP